MNTIVKLDETLWQEGDTAVAAIEKHTAELMGAWLDFGRVVIELRNRNPSDENFGKLCGDRWPNVVYDRRFAAMWWAGLDISQRETLVDMFPNSLVPVSLLTRCKEHKPDWAKLENPTPVSAPEQILVPIASDNPPDSVDDTAVSSKDDNPEPVVLNIGAKSKSKKKAIDIVREFYINPYVSLTMIEKAFTVKEMKRVADLIVEGVLPATNNSSSLSKNFMPRHFFYDYEPRYLMGKLRGKELIKNMDALIEHHTRCEGNFSKRNCDDVYQVMVFKPVIIADPDMSGFEDTLKRSKKRGRIPTTVQNIVVCGVTVWEPGCVYTDYEQAWQVYTFFKIVEKSSNDPSPASRARHMASDRVYCQDWWDAPALTFWGACCDAQYRNPDQYADTHAAVQATKFEEN